MKIVAGACSLDQARYFARSGADEIYFGSSKVASHRNKADSVAGAKELAALLRLCGEAGKPVYLAANEIYAGSEYAGVFKAVRGFTELGGAGLIIRDPGLMDFLRQRGYEKPFVLSTLGHCFNSEALKFYAGLGVSRVTLPQHLAPAEARRLVRNRLGLETEVFCLLGGYCPNVDGSCRFHGLAARGAPGLNCRRAYKAGGRAFTLPMLTRAQRLASLEGFRALGAQYFKIARSYDFEAAKMNLRELLALRERASRAGAAKR